MDVNGSSSESETNNNNNNSNKLEHFFSTIKDSLVDISVELADIKKNIKKNSGCTVPNRSVSFETEENFLRFDQEIQQNTEKFNEFMNVLNKIISNNENQIKSNLPKYYFIVLRSCFKRNLMNNLSWNKYKDKLAVNSTRIFQAIQLSGSAVDSLSTEFDRQNILHKEFKKFKDSCRARKVQSNANEKPGECDNSGLLDLNQMDNQNLTDSTVPELDEHIDFLDSEQRTNLTRPTKNSDDIIIQLTQDEAEKFQIANKENQQTQNGLNSHVNDCFSVVPFGFHFVNAENSSPFQSTQKESDILSSDLPSSYSLANTTCDEKKVSTLKKCKKKCKQKFHSKPTSNKKFRTLHALSAAAKKFEETDMDA